MTRSPRGRATRTLVEVITSETDSSLKRDTYKGLVHGSLDLVRAVAVDLLEELVERRVSLQLIGFLLLAEVHHHLVPVAGRVGRRVLI